ncbi:MAG: DUF3795 domain-containing protein [Pseudomonadota bacterium]
MDFLNMTAPCGLDCFNCPMYHAGLDEAKRMAAAEKLGLPPEKAQCRGCRNEEGTIAFLGMTKPCHVFECITRQGLDFCHQCDDFPCDHLHPYADRAAQVPHNTKVFNLCLIEKMGLEKWADKKAKEVKSTYFKGKFKL